MGWTAAELTEKEGAYHAEVALPGFDAKDVQVTVTPSEMLVHAFSKEEKHREEKTSCGPNLARGICIVVWRFRKAGAKAAVTTA
jgi:HSP20 family molecular chaperone IbpA